MTIRSRDMTYYRKYPYARQISSQKDVGTTGAIVKLRGGQITDSGDHNWPPPKGAFGDFGGPFRTVKLSFDIPAGSYSSRKSNTAKSDQLEYSGPMCTPTPQAPGIANLLLPSLVNSSLEAAGSTAISEVAPTNPHAAASTALGELVKDGIPSIPGISLWEKRTKALVGLSDEFLNTVFGWMPLIKDVTDVASAVSNSSRFIKQYERDGHKHVRRRFDFPVEKTRTEEVRTNESAEIGAGTGSGNFFYDTGHPGTLTIVKETVVRKWFSGCFVYSTPSSATSWNNILKAGDQADHLLGTSLTPEVLWELTPWSWAIDWFTNMGDIMTNVTQFKLAGLVMRYGYIMQEIAKTYTYSLDRSGLIGLPGGAPPPATITLVTKQRMPANPFGFGIGWEGLSPLQLAITAALGITRAL